MSDFKRELRYGVVKLKNLTDHQQKQFWELVDSFDLPQLECVVVESDWPMYEDTWESIEDYSNGTYVHRSTLKNRISELEDIDTQFYIDLQDAQTKAAMYETLDYSQLSVYGDNLVVITDDGSNVQCKNAAVLSFPHNQALHQFLHRGD